MKGCPTFRFRILDLSRNLSSQQKGLYLPGSMKATFRFNERVLDLSV